jgi:hypothetical protein
MCTVFLGSENTKYNFAFPHCFINIRLTVKSDFFSYPEMETFKLKTVELEPKVICLSTHIKPASIQTVAQFFVF